MNLPYALMVLFMLPHVFCSAYVNCQDFTGLAGEHPKLLRPQAFSSVGKSHAGTLMACACMLTGKQMHCIQKGPPRPPGF